MTKIPSCPQPVEVWWWDPAGKSGWCNKETVPSPCFCCSLGFLVKADDKVVVVAGTQVFDKGSEDDISSIDVIPRGAVISITKFRRPTVSSVFRKIFLKKEVPSP